MATKTTVKKKKGGRPSKRRQQNPTARKRKIGKVKRTPGTLVFVEKNGDVMEAPLRKGGTKGAKHCKG